MTLDNCVNTLVNRFHTEVFSQHEVQDASKDTDTHHFGRHGRPYPQRYRNFADCDPFVCGSTLDDNSTVTSTDDLGAAIPEASHRFPSFIIFTFVNDNLSLSLCTPVRPVISFLIVFSEDVLHIIIDLRDNKCDFSVPPRV